MDFKSSSCEWARLRKFFRGGHKSRWNEGEKLDNESVAFKRATNSRYRFSKGKTTDFESAPRTKACMRVAVSTYSLLDFLKSFKSDFKSASLDSVAKILKQRRGILDCFVNFSCQISKQILHSILKCRHQLLRSNQFVWVKIVTPPMNHWGLTGPHPNPTWLDYI